MWIKSWKHSSFSEIPSKLGASVFKSQSRGYGMNYIPIQIQFSSYLVRDIF